MQTVKIKCDASEVKETQQVVMRIVELLKEANSLADELASKKIKLEINI